MRCPASDSTPILCTHYKSTHHGPRADTRQKEAEVFPELDGFEQAWLAAGSLVAVGLLALAALAVFGTWISLAVLLVGTTLAVIANPTVWMPEYRTSEQTSSRELGVCSKSIQGPMAQASPPGPSVRSHCPEHAQRVRTGRRAVGHPPSDAA